MPAVTQRNPLTMFVQYGFRDQGSSGDQIIGRCPFCGKDKHFFINVEHPNKVWDCKSCGRSGGYKGFLEQIIDFGQENFNGVVSKKLSDNRCISETTLRSLKVGYLPSTDLYIVPVFSSDGKNILNIKLYNGTIFHNTAGCPSTMYGLWKIPNNIKDYDTVYVAEGEWDSMVLIECLEAVKDKKSIVVGVPGAGTFRPEVLPLLVGKEVFLCYDNDLAGVNANKKVAKLVAGVASKTWFIKWPKGTPDKYDVRDVHKKEKKAAATLKYLKSIFSIYDTTQSPVTPVSDDFIKGDRVPIDEVYETFRKYLHLPSMEIIDVVYGTVLANRIPGDPVWLFLISPPGGTKSEVIMSCTNCPKIETLSSLTPHTLISGSSSSTMIADPSLIPQWDGKVVLIKDFTSILGLPSAECNEIFSILRDAYDGECSKPFGNGIKRNYKSKFGIIAAVTPIIEQVIEEHASLGERFLRWEHRIPRAMKSREVYIRKAMGNIGKEPEIRAELNSMGKKILMANYTDQWATVPVKYEEKIIQIAQWIAMLRGNVTRDKFRRDVLYRPFSELGTRLLKQLYKLAQGIATFKGMKEVDDSIIRILVHVANASIQSRYGDVLKAIYMQDHHGIFEITNDVHLPRPTTEIILENLMMLGALDKTREDDKPFWMIKKDILEIIKNCNMYKEVL
jgi:hypothetical protein